MSWLIGSGPRTTSDQIAPHADLRKFLLLDFPSPNLMSLGPPQDRCFLSTLLDLSARQGPATLSCSKYNDVMSSLTYALDWCLETPTETNSSASIYLSYPAPSLSVSSPQRPTLTCLGKASCGQTYMQGFPFEPSCPASTQIVHDNHRRRWSRFGVWHRDSEIHKGLDARMRSCVKERGCAQRPRSPSCLVCVSCRQLRAISSWL